MKRFLQVALLCAGCAWPALATNGYSFVRPLTIDHTKVQNSNQSSVPVYVVGPYTYLATTAHGGLVTNASGFDIIFTTDAAGLSPIPYERELYNATTGDCIFWLNVPSLSTTVDTVIYMFYGNSLVTTDQSNKTGTWNSGYFGVLHFPNGTSLTVNDSTSNANNFSGAATAFAETGTIDGGMACNGTTSTLNAPNTASMNITSDFTFEAWINFGGLVSSFEEVSRKGVAWFFFINGANQAGLGINNDFASAAVWSPAANTNYHVVATYTGSTRAVNLYINGSLFNTRTTATTMVNNTTNLFLCASESGTQFSGVHLDEMRWSNVARSADYIKTIYNSESSPATFYTVGAQSTNSSTSAVGVTLILQ